MQQSLAPITTPRKDAEDASVNLDVATFAAQSHRAWSRLSTIRRVLYIIYIVLSLVAFVLSIIYAGVATPRTQSQALAWVARCYQDPPSTAKWLDPPATPNTFPWAGVSQSEIASLPSRARAMVAGFFVIFAGAFTLLVLPLLVLIEALGSIAMGTFHISWLFRKANRRLAALSVLSMITGLVLFAMAITAYITTHMEQFNYGLCHGTAWNSVSSPSTIAQKPAFLHPNWKHNDPKAVPIVGIPFMGLVGLIGECLCAASVAMGTLAVHRDDDATAPASQSEAYEGDKADHV